MSVKPSAFWDNAAALYWVAGSKHVLYAYVTDTEFFDDVRE